MKFRLNWCPTCKEYLPPKGASSHKCLYKGTVFIGESKIKCYWHNKKEEKMNKPEWALTDKEVQDCWTSEYRPKPFGCWEPDKIELATQKKLLKHLIVHFWSKDEIVQNILREMLKQLEGQDGK